jgi:SAM-dependent methyltransferase
MAEPENFIVAYAHLVRPGSHVLDAAAGSGRHSFFFARRACRVFAVEREYELVNQLRQAGVECAQGDIENWSLLPGTFDVVVNTFFLHRPLLRQYSASLRPNGLLFLRTFTTQNMDVLGRHKPRREFLLEPGELRRMFADLNIVHYEETIEVDRAIGTIVAQKPIVMTE